MDTETNKSSQPRVMVAQRGARRRYAVPMLLHQHGYLHQLVTDSHADSMLGRAVRLLGKFLPVPGAMRRLGARTILSRGIPSRLILATDRWFWHDRKLQKIRAENVARWFVERDRIWFGLIAGGLRFSGCNVLYTMAGENVQLLREARARGIKVVVDAFISPFNLRETLEVKQRLGITPVRDELEHESTEAHYRLVYGLADKILCPSQWVADAMVELDPQFAGKVVVCPYGSSLRMDPSRRRPVAGRVFWAGGDWLRKGLDQLAAAADLLKESHPDYEFRAAGITDPEVLAMPRFRNIKFLGKLSRERMEEEFLTADLFAFPTLSEGMAAVVVEAIAAGCPVITTRAAGIDAIESGKSGVLLQSNDPGELAGHIESLCGDRSRLAGMSKETEKLAAHYTDAAWGERLCRLIEEVLE